MKAIGNNIIITPYSGNIEETKGGLLLTSKQREDIRYNKALVESVSDDIKKLAEEKFLKVKEAYDTIVKNRS